MRVRRHILSEFGGGEAVAQVRRLPGRAWIAATVTIDAMAELAVRLLVIEAVAEDPSWALVAPFGRTSVAAAMRNLILTVSSE